MSPSARCVDMTEPIALQELRYRRSHGRSLQQGVQRPLDTTVRPPRMMCSLANSRRSMFGLSPETENSHGNSARPEHRRHCRGHAAPAAHQRPHVYVPLTSHPGCLWARWRDGRALWPPGLRGMARIGDAPGASRHGPGHRHEEPDRLLGQRQRLHHQGQGRVLRHAQAARRPVRRHLLPCCPGLEGGGVPPVGSRLLRRVPPGLRLELPPGRQCGDSDQHDERGRPLPLSVDHAGWRRGARLRRADRARNAPGGGLPGRDGRGRSVEITQALEPSGRRSLRHGRPGADRSLRRPRHRGHPRGPASLGQVARPGVAPGAREAGLAPRPRHSDAPPRPALPDRLGGGGAGGRAGPVSSRKSAIRHRTRPGGISTPRRSARTGTSRPTRRWSTSTCPAQSCAGRS